MDGKTLLYRLRNMLNEDSSGVWMDDRTSYDYLWEAAKMFVSRTEILTSHQEFVTVAEQPNYVLNADFLKLYLTDSRNRFFVKYSDGSSDTMITYKDYEDILNMNYTNTKDINQSTLTTSATALQDTGQDFSDWETTSGNATHKVTLTNTIGGEFWAYLGAASTTTNTDDTVAVYTDKALSSTGWNGGTPSGTASFYKVENVSSQSIPSHFTIRDKQALNDPITGTATSTGSLVGTYDSTLTDTAATFITSEKLNIGDAIHNTTDSSDGVILSISSDTAADVALFGGTNNYFTSDDAYRVQPQGRVEIYFDPPPSTSGHIVRVHFISRPAPVYSDYGIYRFRQHSQEALVKYAAWLYKYRDSEPDFGDKWFLFFDAAVRTEISHLRPYLKKRGWTVNLKKRR